MFWHRLARWITFFLVSLPFQLFTYSIYPLLAVYYWFFVRGKFGQPITPPNPPRWTVDYMVEQGKQDPIRDNCYLDNQDAHSALTHMYLWYLRPELAQEGMKNLIYEEQGGLRRRYPNDDWVPVSGDALSSWVSSYILFGGDKELLRKLAKHYLANKMGLGAYDFDWQVSSRSDNGGIGYVIDGEERLTDAWYAYINQPCLGPQYFTSAALFLLASKELGGLWKLWYYVHFLVMGGWIFSLIPFVGLPNNDFYYVKHITVLNAYSCYALSKNPIYKWCLRYLAVHCAPSGNVDPMLYCFLAKAGALSKEELSQALLAAQSIKRAFPQNAPNDSSFYDSDLNQPIFSIAAAAAKMLKEENDK